jgi:hypothetical protein
LPPRRPSIPKLPELLDRKIYKTGQTRGADDDVIFQNRVARTSTVLIPYNLYEQVGTCPNDDEEFENGFIVLLTPQEYFENPNIANDLIERGLELGQNALVFYQIRTDWEANNPEELGWIPANRRTAPLGGNYVARIAATTASANGHKINHGFNTTGMKGAGIRLFEYANTATIAKSRIQLEAIFWLCHDSMEAVTEFGMSEENALTRKNFCLSKANEEDLLDYQRLINARMTDSNHQTICPLCLEPLSAFGFFNRLAQALGREVHDLTVTEINLFHIQELRYGQFNHCPYNLGWGHHHCNVVVKDAGINETISWMNDVVQRNIEHGYFDN